MKLLLFLLALPCFGQVVQIDCGSLSDQYFSGGIAWAGPWTGKPPADQTLRFGNGVPFSYLIPLQSGLYDVVITLIEPNQTGPGKRLMSISADGFESGALDVYALAGGMNLPYPYRVTLRSSGVLTLRFAATVGKPIVSSITAQLIATNTSFQAPMTFGPRCERDGEHQFNLGPDNMLCICKIQQPNPVWMCSPVALVEK